MLDVLSKAKAEREQRREQRLAEAEEKIASYIDDYLDEMIEAGFQSVELGVCPDLEEVSLDAIDPRGRHLYFTGGPVRWDFPDNPSWTDKLFWSTVGKTPNALPRINVSGDSFLKVLKAFIRAFSRVDWTDPAGSMSSEFADQIRNEDIGWASVDQSDTKFKLTCFTDEGEHRITFSYYMDRREYEEIVDSLFDHHLDSLTRGGCKNVNIRCHPDKEGVSVSGVSREGFGFTLSCKALGERDDGGYVYKSHVFRDILSRFISAFLDVDWLDGKNSLHSKMLGQGLHVNHFEKIGVCKFTATALLYSNQNKEFVIDVVNDKESFIKWRNAEKERQETLAEELIMAELEEQRTQESLRQLAEQAIDEYASRGEWSSCDSMDGHEFEAFCAAILEQNGFQDVSVTRGSGDQGIDVLATKDFIKYGFQCKCYSTDIGNKAVQEAYAGKTYYGCHVAVVLTNRYFTPAAKGLAAQTGVVLWDRDKLLSMMG